MDRQTLLGEIRQRSLEAHGRRLHGVVLCGSEARGESRPDSDIDVLVLLEGRTFTGHSTLEAAVHRDLVKADGWSADLGRDYSFCVNVRGVGDYGDEVRVDARQAVAARRILEGSVKPCRTTFLA